MENLAHGLAALEAQRATLGDAVVDALLAPGREKLAALQAQASAPHAKNQRKQVTVLFAHLAGFTALAETLSAEDATTFINTLWQRLDAVVLAHGGRIDKHLGDAVMALWGTATAREDDPERAIRAALALQAVIKEQKAEGGKQKADASAFCLLPSDLQMRIGLNTGPVLLGTVGSTGEFTAMGDTVNVAARLEQAAPLDGILIAHATYRQVRGIFEVRAQPPLTVKGKAEPLQVYVVTGLQPRALRLLTRGVEGRETRLVGRAAELAQLQTAFTEVVAQRQPRALTVVAEAGLGKSRLMQEFIQWAAVTQGDFHLLRGRATPSTGETPYALLRDLLAGRFEIQESDAVATARAKLETGLAALCPTDPHIQEKAHFIGHLAGWDFSASPYIRGLLGDVAQIRALALHFLTLVFHTAATPKPVVLLLEDVHWADRGSLDALRQVLGNLPPATPLLTLANARPTLFERDPAWQITAQTRVDLHPLSEADSTALVSDILRQVADLPEALRALIVQQAEGNPFYVEELIKMLMDEKVILPSETAWHVTPDRLATLRVPPTLTGVLQARLDSLPPAERLTLQRAAVVGRIFWDTAVQALSPEALPLPAVQALCGAAQQRALLVQHEPPAFAATREYAFQHALLRDVAYETVLKRDRAGYHARAAQWLASMSGAQPGAYWPQIAEHHEKAGNLPQAAHGFEQAGDYAMRVSAFAEAARFYRRVPTPTSRTHLKLAEAHYRLSEFPAARAALAQAQTTATTDADRAAAWALLGELTKQLGDYAAAQQMLTTAVALAQASGDDLTLCRAFYAQGTNEWRLGHLATARTALEASLALARAGGDVTRELFALLSLGNVLTGTPDEERLYQEVLTRAQAVGNRELAMAALNNLGVAALERQAVTAARDNFQQALALARAMGAQQRIALYLLNLAECDLQLGQLAAARTGLREGLALAWRVGAQPRVVSAVRFFGYLAYAEGQPARALELLGLARHHPAWSSDHQRALGLMLAQWALDPAVVEAGLAQGATLDWDATVQALLERIPS